MAKQKLRSLITSFTPDGDYLAILSPDGTVKIWNTSHGSLLAEWKQSDSDSVVSYSCMACGFIGKKHKKDIDSCLVVLGTSEGDIFAIDVLDGQTKWKSTGFCPSGIAGLSFTDKGHSLHAVGCNGKAFEMNSETGEILKEFKASKKPISLFSFSHDNKFLALASRKMRVISLENGKEILKFPDDLDPAQYMSISDNARAIITAGLGEKHLKLWYCDLSSKTVVRGPVLYMKQPPLALECQNDSNDVGGFVILAISDSGVAYVWNLETGSEDEVKPTKITVKANKAERDQKKSANSKKSRASIISARLLTNSRGKGVSAHIAYGPLHSPQFSVVNVSKMGEDMVIIAGDEEETETIQENGEATGRGIHSSESGLTVDPSRQANKKRGASDPDLETTRGVDDTGHGENMDGVLDDDPNEPTMGEKLASLNLIDEDKTGSHGNEERQESTPVTKPPSADSVNVLLKQALHADDRALLLECLYTQDEKVIKNSISLLNPSDVLRLLRSLVSIIQSRGAVLACALPWIKNLLLQHASGIISQESSLHSLNSLYQLIESRVSTFESALQVSSCLDFLFAGIVEDEEEEENATVPVIFEDNDESDEEELSDDAMETDRDSEEGEEALDEALDGISDFEGIEDMSD